METRVLGGSCLATTRLGFGLAAVGRPAYINLGRSRDFSQDRRPESLRQLAHELLDVAYAGGVRYFDAARSYGRAEEYLASWLARRHPLVDPVTCGSKWGYTYVGNWSMTAAVHEAKDHSLAALTRQYKESAAILGANLQLYQVHSATLESGILTDLQVLRELTRLRQGGLAIGLTVSGPRQKEVIHKALAVSVDGFNPFSTVQATWNLLDPSVGAALEAAHEAGWGVLVKESLANGRLLQTQDPLLGPVLDIATRRQVGPDVVALAAALAQPFVDVVLLGSVTAAQLQSNLAATEVCLTPDELEELATVARSPETYWEERRLLRWS
ncbi:MAG: aldo/keto reductase [Candidatus Dormibacteria bacterium]